MSKHFFEIRRLFASATLLLAGTLAGGISTAGTAEAGSVFSCSSVKAKADQCTALTPSPTLWPDVCSPNRVGWTPTQGSFDQLSWINFTAMNWPVSATQRGVPDTSKTLGATDAQGNFLPTVWESFKGLDEVFGVGALKKSDWNKTEPVPSICPQGTGLRTISMTSKSRSSTVDAHAAAGPLQSVNQAVGGPLPDQQGNLVQYEIRINKVMFDDIVDKKAWDKSKAELTCTGKYATKTCVPFEFSEGALESKGAWKVMTGAEKTSGNFFVRDMLVYIPADPVHKQKASCSKQTMGLVGLHISRKTPLSTVASAVNSGSKKNPDWAWTTFEHGLNAPMAGGAGSSSGGVEPGIKWTFNNASCSPAVTAAQCASAPGGNNATPNPDPKYACCQNLLRYGDVGPKGDPYTMKRGPIQVTRIDTSPPTTQTCNKVWDQTVRSSIWSRYFLVATQWPKKADGPPFTPVVTPSNVRNTVIETYLASWNKAGTQQTNTSSCMGCHKFGVDMSFIFSK